MEAEVFGRGYRSVTFGPFRASGGGLVELVVDVPGFWRVEWWSGYYERQLIGMADYLSLGVEVAEGPQWVIRSPSIPEDWSECWWCGWVGAPAYTAGGGGVVVSLPGLWVRGRGVVRFSAPLAGSSAYLLNSWLVVGYQRTAGD